MKELEYATPESVGLPSEAVCEFLEFIKTERFNLHSFILIKDEKIISEGYYAPFLPTDKKRLYSCTKTLAALAVGRLIGEGLARLDAPLISYFPEVECTDQRLREITVEDTLKMAVPLSANPYCLEVEKTPDAVTTDRPWVADFFSGRAVCDKVRGHLFDYNSHASYMLGALVKRLTGKEFLDYLRPVLNKIGVSEDIECVKSPEGIDWGSSGALMSTRDFAKIGLLLLNKGMYHGEELLPHDFMERATKKQIDNLYCPDAGVRTSGYGYQVWIEPYGYGMHGMLGQMVFCFPKKNFLFVCNSSECHNYTERLYYCASRLYLSIKDAPLSEGEEYEKLKGELESLKIDRVFGAAHSPLEEKINKKRYNLDENGGGFSWFTLDFNGDGGILHFEKDGEVKKLPFGCGKYADTLFPEVKYYGMIMNIPSGKEPRTLVSASWTMENRLLIVADVADTLLGTLSLTFEFWDDRVALRMVKNGEGLLGEYQGTFYGTLAE